MKAENENNQQDDPREDQIGENAGHDLTKGNLPTEQKKEDDERVHTVAPDNDSGAPGPPAEESGDSSNTDGGPKEENL